MPQAAKTARLYTNMILMEELLTVIIGKMDKYPC